MLGKWIKKISSLLGTAPRKPDDSGISAETPAPKPVATTTREPVPASIPRQAIPRKASPPPAPKGRTVSRQIIIGLDFGTAYTKIIVRDANDPSAAYLVLHDLPGELPWLLPSVVYDNNGELYTALDKVPENSRRIDYLKMRLVAAVDKKRAKAWAGHQSAHSIQVVVGWYLARVLAVTENYLKKEIWPDYGQHSNDCCHVNIGVPIAYEKDSPVEAKLLAALYAAYTAAIQDGVKAPSPDTIASLLGKPARLKNVRDYCHSYPETSAILQSYIKSSGRRTGIYLLLDVGAGTVDLSFFRLWWTKNSNVLEYYFHSDVLDFGSSLMELLMCQFDNTLALEDARRYKENPSQPCANSAALKKALNAAREKIYEEVMVGVGEGLKVTEPKLHPDRRRQLAIMKELRIFFSGGGFVDNPYRRSVYSFQQARKWEQLAPIERIPYPNDIDWKRIGGREHFHRLAVAYGLSFPQWELGGVENSGVIVPSGTKPPDVPPPKPRERPVAPTKDEV